MIYILEEEGVINDNIRNIFAAINNGIYTLIANTFNLIEDLARISILSYGDMKEFAQRIYALLGLFMLFKLSFSILNYIIDPNKISDKSVGMGSVIKNVVITMVLVLIVPTCFSLLYEAQDAILTDNVIVKLLLGDKDDKISDTTAALPTFNISPAYCEKNSLARDNGQYLALMIFRPFFQPLKEVDDFKNQPVYEEYCNDESAKGIDSYLRSKDIYNAADGTNLGWANYDIDFTYFVALIVGIGIELIILGIAMDVAVRSIKLAFLQLISPIPIVSYIDPKSGKDGMFKRWYTEVFKTWASLFIRLIAVFFGIYLIQKLNESDTLYLVGNSDYEVKSGNLWIMLFLIVGVLMFMKQVPSLLESLIPGMKGAGSFKLNPLKKVSEEAIGGKYITGAAVGAGVMAATAVGSAGANFAVNKLRGKSWKDSFKSAGNGLFTGAYYGGKNGFNAGKSGKYNMFKTTMDSVEENSKYRNKTDDLIAANKAAHEADPTVKIDKMPFKIARQAAHDKVTDVIGDRKPATGTTSIIKDQIKQAELNLANAKRDEEAASIAMSNLSSQDGYKAGMYAEAFKTKVTFNKEGETIYQRTNGGDYRKWIENRTGQNFNDWQQAIQQNLNSTNQDYRNASQEQREIMVADELNKKISGYYGNDNLTIDEYKNYETLYNQRNEADQEGRKYEKEITKKKELYGKSQKKQ